MSALPVFVLTGPTGVGKSDWAIRLAQDAPVEIVSVDSALVYKGLDIGAAKPCRAVRERIAHHLVDICEPTESYSAGRFVTDAIACIAQVHARRRVPLLVGGTMLYIRALVHGLAPLPQASPELRAQLDERATREGWPALHTELLRLDPRAGERIALNEYKAGTNTYLNVSVAQAAALTAERSALDLQARRLNAAAALVSALGGGW